MLFAKIKFLKLNYSLLIENYPDSCHKSYANVLLLNDIIYSISNALCGKDSQIDHQILERNVF